MLHLLLLLLLLLLDLSLNVGCPLRDSLHHWIVCAGGEPFWIHLSRACDTACRGVGSRVHNSLLAYVIVDSRCNFLISLPESRMKSTGTCMPCACIGELETFVTKVS